LPAKVANESMRDDDCCRSSPAPLIVLLCRRRGHLPMGL